MTKIRLMPSNHWDWSMPVPFSQGWKTDGLIFVGGRISPDAKGRTAGSGDIAVRTRKFFEFMQATLDEANAGLADIVKLDTCYRFEGEAIAKFWEQMTKVRMEYLAAPGPVGTGVRVNGSAYEGLLIEIEAIADVRP